MALNWLNFKYPLAVSFIKPLIRRWLKAGRRPNWFKESGHGISSAGIEFFCLHRLGLQFNLKIFRLSFWINWHKLTAKNSNVDRCGSGRSERQTSPIAHQLQHVAAGGTGTGVPGQSLPGRLHARGPGHAARPQGVASCCKLCKWAQFEYLVRLICWKKIGKKSEKNVIRRNLISFNFPEYFIIWICK